MNGKITIQQIADLLAEKHGMEAKEAELFVKTIFETIEAFLSTEKYVKIKGLGTFKLTEVDSRESVNVNTGERIEIQGHTKVSYTPDTTMKELINKPFSHFETVVLNEGVELEDTTVIEDGVSEEMTGLQAGDTSPVVSDTNSEEGEGEIIIPKEKEKTVEDKPQKNVEELLQSVEGEAGEKVYPFMDEVKEESVPVASASSHKRKDVTGFMLTTIIIVLVALILMGFYALFMRTEKSEEPIPPVYKESVYLDTEEQNADSLIAGKDSVQSVSVRQNMPESVTPKNDTSVKVAVLSDTLEYEIVGTQATHVLKDGETLIKLSVRFFGSKNFWPYIVKHNSDVVKNADRVPIGTSLRIPELKAKQ